MIRGGKAAALSGVLAAVAAAAPMASAHAGAAPRREASAGASFTLNSQWTGALFAERLGDTRAFGPFAWRPDFALGWVAARSTHRANLDHDVVLVALGARIFLWRQLFLSEQGALIAGRTDALSSAGEFVSSLGWEGRRWTAMVRHISNADLHTPNRGETMLLVGLRF